MHTAAGALREQLSSTLTTAYGRGLLSEHTLAMRLESLLRENVVDPDLLIGDLCLRRPEDTLRGRLSQTLGSVRGRVEMLFVDGDAPMPTLLALDWSGQPSELLLGRNASCDIVFSDIEISREHARLRCRDGRWALEDLGSTNGTTLNGRPVGRCELRPGDDLQLGNTRLRID
jgi:hypothetical protein